MTAALGPSVPVTDREGRRAGAAAVAGGLLALTAATIVLQLLIGQVIPPVVVFEVVFVGLAVGLLRASRPVLRWAAVVLPLVLVAANLPIAVADLQHPESVAGFVPTLAIMVLAVATAGLGVLHARGRAVPGRIVWGAVAVVLGVGTVASVGAAAGLTDDVAAPGDVTVEVADLSYPERLVVGADEGVLLDNLDPFRHTFVVEGTDLAVELPGSTARRVALDLAPGEYRYLCDVPGHESMAGVLVVE